MGAASVEELLTLPLFHDIEETGLDWLVANSRVEHLAPGERFFVAGETRHEFYVVLEGELQISRPWSDGERVMGTTPRGIIGGEMPLLSGGASPVTAQAIMPTRLLVLDSDAFRGIFANAPEVGRRILATATERLGGIATMATQDEKMAALGKLSAGLAHELNNPAAAARRASKLLREVLPGLQADTLALNRLHLPETQRQSFLAFQRDAMRQDGQRERLSPIEEGEREDAIGEWLEELEVEDAWELAAEFVAAGVTPDDLEALVAELDEESVGPILAWLGKALNAGSLLEEIENATSRISDLIGAVKSYTFMDQAPVQAVDVHAGLDTTLMVLRHKLGKVNVSREYAANLPPVVGRGTALNQVWTNLIDNALDALNGEGHLRLITRHENDFVMVEVNDSGPGVPQDLQARIFEPFFTTKDVGRGTGLGLDITYRIVREHKGTLELRSAPGETRFIVRLPLDPENLP